MVFCCIFGLIFGESQIFNFGDFSWRPVTFSIIFELLELLGTPDAAQIRNLGLFKNLIFSSFFDPALGSHFSDSRAMTWTCPSVEIEKNIYSLGQNWFQTL